MKTLFKKGIRQFWKDLNGTFLIILVTGIFTSVVLLSRVIVFLLENHEYKIWGFFFGLIIASAFVILKDIKTLNLKNIIIVLFGFAIAAGVVLSNTTNLPNTDLYIFFSGSIAITAMILPGISGSFILLLLSKYEFIINAIKDFDLRIILVFGFGCVFGLLIFSRLLHFLFQNYKDNLLCILSGFLIGSLIKIWPFRKVLETRTNSEGINEVVVSQPVLPSPQDLESLLIFTIFSICGYLLITIIQKKSIL
jgi:putative membrane protein